MKPECDDQGLENESRLQSPFRRAGLGPLLEMVNHSVVVDTVKLPNNELNYDSIQNIVKAASTHPSLTHLDLSSNPLTTAGGRALLRLVRTNHRIRGLQLKGCGLSADICTQINTALRENELRKGHKDVSFSGSNRLTSLPSMPHHGSVASPLSHHRQSGEPLGSLPLVPHVSRKNGMNVAQRMQRYP